MTDTPDLRTLAAFAANDVLVETPEEVADAVLAAVLPEHRRQVLDEAADACSAREDEANQTYCRDLAFGPGTPSVRESPARPRTWRAAKELLRELASAAPETAPRPRQDDETAPAVGREAAQAQRAAEAAARVPLAEVLDALRDHDAFVEWTRSNGPSGYLADYVGRDDRDSCARYLAERFPTAPQAAEKPWPGPLTPGLHLVTVEDTNTCVRCGQHVLPHSTCPGETAPQGADERNDHG